MMRIPPYAAGALIMFLMMAVVAWAGNGDWQPLPADPMPDWMTKTQVAERQWTHESGAVYIVRYEYSAMSATVPATMNGQPHYPAEVTVFRLIAKADSIGMTDIAREQVGEPLGGTYTSRGCFEDVPELYVRKVLGEPYKGR